METIDFSKTHKELYTAKKKPQIVVADAATFFSVEAEGLKIKGPAHEIYISDPCRVAPERLKTIVRLGVTR